MSKTTRTIAGLVAVGVLGFGMPLGAAERLNDRMVKQVVENIDRAFKSWKNDLEREKLDTAAITNAAGTVNVKDYLRNLEQDIRRAKDRLDKQNAASPEVTALLRRASDVERRNAGSQSAPRPSWSTLSAQLQSLATAYGVSWPIREGEVALRLTDRELATRAKELGDAANRLSGPMKKAVGKEVPKAAVTAAENDLKELQRVAKALESGLKNGRATSAEAGRALELVSKSRQFVSGLAPLSPAGTTAMNTISRSVEALSRAFHMGMP